MESLIFTRVFWENNFVKTCKFLKTSNDGIHKGTPANHPFFYLYVPWICSAKIVSGESLATRKAAAEEDLCLDFGIKQHFVQVPNLLIKV